MDITLTGLDAVDRLFLRLSAFQSLVRKPMSAALGEAKRIMVGNVGSRKAARAMKVYVSKEPTGLVGRVGPKGGKPRAGFLAAKFLETGTGVFGPKGRRVNPRSGKVMVIPSMFDATGASRGTVTGRMFTAAGALRVSSGRRGTIGIFATTDTGMHPKPWYDRSRSQAEPRIAERFAAELSREIHGGN